ncbi:MAG: PHP domain-containing protein, partial [Treponema sp.]|nr:PHP domain-containing protein [Treponema sp.]
MDARLGLCSAYSLLYGIHKPATILERATSYGVKTVSFCDINNLYGVHTFLEEAKERQIRPIIGATLTAGTHTSGAVYCFVENRKGFGRLCEILSERNKDIPQFNPLSFLRENADGLILASADNKALCELTGRVRKLYAAITPDDIRVLCKHKELPLAFLDTSVFLDKSDYAVHKVLRAIDLNKTIGSLSLNDTDNDSVSDEDGLFKASKDLRKRLNSWPEATKGTLEIVEACQFR